MEDRLLYKERIASQVLLDATKTRSKRHSLLIAPPELAAQIWSVTKDLFASSPGINLYGLAGLYW